MDLLTKNVPKSRLGCPQARFCEGLGSSQAPLGRLLGVLGRLLDALRRLLGASWLPNAVQEGPGLDFGGFWERPGRVSEVPRLYFSWVFRTFRYIMVLIVQ